MGDISAVIELKTLFCGDAGLIMKKSSRKSLLEFPGAAFSQVTAIRYALAFAAVLPVSTGSAS